MKLVTKSRDATYLHSLKGLLEANGIPADVQGENTARMITPFLMTEPSLWVYLDEQLSEAVKLIQNDEYVVENQVNVEEFYEINKNITSDTTFMNEAYIKLGLTVVGWMLGFFILFKILVWLTT
jgi:uncharacterized protein YciI